MGPVGRERTEREEQLQRHTEGDTAQGPVVKAKKDPSGPSLDEWDGYRGWCPFCVAVKGKSEAHRRMEEPHDHGHLELHLDDACMGWEAGDRASPTLVGTFPKDRWVITHPVSCKGTQHRWIFGMLVNDVITSGVQTLVVESDQEVSISLVRELRVVEGSH